MLGRDADALHRKEGDRQLVRQNFADPLQIGLGDKRIDAERQMRPMLLHRGERQHGDPARRFRRRQSPARSSPSSCVGAASGSLANRAAVLSGCNLTRNPAANLDSQPETGFFRDHALLSRRREEGAIDAVCRDFSHGCCRARGVTLLAADAGSGAGAGARQSVVRHQLGRRRRARRLLSGARRRHLSQARPRRDHRAGRPEREQPHPAAGRQDRFLPQRQHAAELRCRRAEHPDHRSRRPVSEGPAGSHRASRSGHREIHRPEKPDAVRLRRKASPAITNGSRPTTVSRIRRSSPTPSIRSRSSWTRKARCRAM